MRKLFLHIGFCLVAFVSLAQGYQRPLLTAESAYQSGDISLFRSSSKEALAAVAKEEGNYSTEHIGVMDQILEMQLELGLFDDARGLAGEAIQYFAKTKGKEDTVLAGYYGVLGGADFFEGNYTGAKEQFQKAIDTFEKSGYTTSPTYAELLSNLGLMMTMAGNFEDAMDPLRKAYDFFNNDKEKYVFERAIISSNYANALHEGYRLTEAEPVYQESLDLFEALGDNSSVDYLNTYNNYITLLIDKGDYAGSENVVLAFEKKMERKSDSDPVAYAKALNNSAVVANALGNYQEAEKKYRMALDIKGNALGKRHPDYVLGESNLASFYMTMGRLGEAHALLEEVVDKASGDRGNQGADLLQYQNNFASVLRQEFDTKAALKLQEKVVEQAAVVYGKDNMQYFYYLNNLAQLYVDMGEADEATRSYNTLYTHPAKEASPLDYIIMLHNYAAFLSEQGVYEQAAAYHQQSLNLMRDHFGEGHPDYNLFKVVGAINFDRAEKPAEAFDQYASSLAGFVETVNTIFPFLTEVEKSQYLSKIIPYTQNYYAFALKNREQFLQVADQSLTIRFNTKSLTLRASEAFRRHVENAKDGKLKADYEKWMKLKNDYARYIQLSNSKRKKLGVDLEELEKDIYVLEKSLVEKVGEKGQLVGYKEWTLVRDKLKEGEAAVEIVKAYDLTEKEAEPIYIAYIVKPGMEHPMMVEIGRGKDYDRKFYHRYRNNINLIFTDKKSYEVYWKPVSDALGDVKKIYFSPEGVYHKININTLYNPATDKYLMDEVQIHLRANLIELAANVDYKGTKTAVLFGHPSYYLNLEEGLTAYAQGQDISRSTVEVDPVIYSDLPGTKVEVEAINTLCKSSGWKTTLFTEEFALENEVKKVTSPEILHFATHGFFEDNPADSLNRFSGSYYTDPLFYSGIVLSGGGVDYTIDQVEAKHVFENGILNAYEAKGLNLSQTNLVVLSACQTGLGSLRDEEGVFGLQRSFLIAGSRHVIMSLWSVDDAATKDLMIKFYELYLSGEAITSAFQQAQQFVKGKYKDPVYWGAFVLLTR